MIDAPLNDTECLGLITEMAGRASLTPEAQALAARFPSTRALVEHIRALPQRDDSGDPADGPRVACDVSQRARVFPEDPNCVERALMYLALAELIDPAPTRQLATVDVSRTVRHTFPVENGEPVVLDPEMRRNGLRAALWQLRNGNARAELAGPVDLAPIVGWLFDLATDEAEERGHLRTVTRIEHARRALRRLVRGGPVTLAERADVLYALGLAGEVAREFGRVAEEGYELARATIARLLTRASAHRQAIRIDPERAIYWGGKAIATYYGVGGLYDVAYGDVRRATSPRRTRRPRPRPVAPRPTTPPPAAPPRTTPADTTTTATPPPVATAPATETNEEKGDLE
jgi:hypothetical protein